MHRVARLTRRSIVFRIVVAGFLLSLLSFLIFRWFGFLGANGRLGHLLLDLRWWLLFLWLSLRFIHLLDHRLLPPGRRRVALGFGLVGVLGGLVERVLVLVARSVVFPTHSLWILTGFSICYIWRLLVIRSCRARLSSTLGRARLRLCNADR